MDLTIDSHVKRVFQAAMDLAQQDANGGTGEVLRAIEWNAKNGLAT